MKSRFQLRRLLSLGCLALLLGALLSGALFASAHSAPRLAAERLRAESLFDLAQETPVPSRAPTADPAAQLRQAWELTRLAGKYAFASDLVYTTYPALALANAGRGPQRNELHLEGAVDLPAQKLEAKFWQGGSVLTPDNGGEARIEGDRAYVKAPGGEWQETEGQGLSSGFAPGADPLAFLSGMTNVREEAAELNAFGVTAMHYVFDIDGPAFATYLRDQMEQQLRDAGKLPLNVNLDTSEQFRNAQGSGEVWLDGRGLPLRLVTRLAFPAQENGARVETDVRTDFSGYPEQLAQPPSPLAQPLAWAGAALDKALVSPATAARTAGAPGSVLCGFGLMALLIGCRRSRRLYAIVVIAVSLSMVVVPLMQSGQVSAYFERQNAQRAAQSAEQAAAEEARAASAAMSPEWNPQQDPLAAGSAQDGQPTAPDPVASLAGATPTPTPSDSVCNQSDTADPDADGVTNYEECLYTTLPNDADTDDDGLTDSQELNRLGTDPTNPDTDGDSITDKVETQGWLYDKMWYLNPKNADTNGDGLADGIECPTLIQGKTPGAECDADGDRMPDPFDRDDDNDGVPDQADLSPTRAFSRSGLGVGVPAADAAFNKTNPLQLSVSELQSNWPALVDIQLRPTNPDHLAYALNVLDWPVDADGQIQHAKSTTFADSDNADIRSPQDMTGANGDMRLIPLLELTITGKAAPLKLADPQAQVAVRGAFSATVTLAQQAANHANTDLSFKFGSGGSYDVMIYDGSCPGAGAPLATYKAVTNGAGKTWTGMKLNNLADGSSSLVVSQSGKTACADIPDLVTGPYTDRMIDQAALAAYGATASDSGGALLVHVPLNVVPDESGGGKTAFQARMLYWPGSEADGGNLWQEPQQARVVWAVNMITDECDSTGFPSWTDYQKAHPDKTEEDYDKELDAHCAAHRATDQMQVIQTYDESWYLTGLSVREDHGLDVSIAYPNPARPYDDDGLWGLSYGLSQQFMPGEDCESDATILTPPDPWTCRPDGKRDISVFPADSRGNAIGNSTISGRFDAASGVTGPARWGIPQGSLRVEDFRYPHTDYITYLAGHNVPPILRQFDTSVEPTLLYTREERYRIEGLVGGAASGSLLTINLATGSHPEELTTGMNWAPYRYNPALGADGAVIGWEAYPPDEYWDKLDDVLRARFQQLFPDSSADEIEGEMLVARSYYVALMSGVTQAVIGPIKAVVNVSNVAVVNSLIKVSAFMVYSVTTNILSSTLKTYMKYKTSWDSFKMREALGSSELPPAQPSVRKSLFESVSNFFGWKSLFKAGPVAVGIGLALVAVTALVIALCFSKLAVDTTQVGMIVRGLLAVNVALNAQLALSAFASAMNTTQSFGEWAKSLSGGALKIGIVVMAIKVVITWALFGIQCALGHWKFGSMAMDNAAAAAIASTITAILLFAIFAALGGLGALIGAFIGLLDAIVGLMCNAFLTKEQQASKSGQWLCGGITGIISGVIKWLIYSGAVLPNLAPDKESGYPFYPRLTFGNFKMSLADPARGLVAGNLLSVGLELTNTISLADPPKSALAWAWSEQWSDDNLVRSTFAYRMQEAQKGFDSSLHLGQIEDEWRSPYIEDAWSYKASVSSEPITLTAGLNHPIANLYLSEAFAVPEQECWGLLVGGCSIKTEKATNHFDLGTSMIMDVLPANLDDFRRLSPTGRKWTLAWGWEGDLPFPAQNDADGDGLAADVDVNDSKWDADGDGLSDLYEQEIGSNPLQKDADGDNLWDADEARLGTNPRLKDTDGDGLTDKEELDGWEIAYGKAANGGQLTTRVTSDPTIADADGDALVDRQERTFGFNPNTPSSAQVLTLNSEVSEDANGVRQPADGVVTPGEKLYTTATVKNELDLRQAEGLFSTQATSLLDKAGIGGPKSFVLNSEEETTATGELTVDPNAAAGAHSLTQMAGALITDWRTLSGGASLWLRFDDAPGATSYADTAGYLPARPGSCTGTGCSIVTTGRYGNGIHLNGTDYVHSDALVSAGESSVAFWFKGDFADPGTTLMVLKAADGRARANIFLTQGQVCSRVEGSAAVCAPVTATQWHHVAVTYSSAQGGKMTLYIDGRLINSAIGPGEQIPYTNYNVSIGGGWYGSRPFAGTFDDVRLYPRVLTVADVRGLAHQPLFHMDFESNTPWKDVSAFNSPVSCSSPNCPAISPAGAQGSAGLFNGKSFLNVASSPQLDLSAGQYSMSAWVYADNNCGFDVMQGNQNGYIIGMDNRNAPYPSMYLGMDAGNTTAESVGAYFSPQTTGTYYVESEDLVPLRKWVHLVITFDVNDTTYPGGTWRLYSNGKQVWTQRQVNPGEKPLAVTNFQVGLTNTLQDKTDHSFCGKLDELMIYNEVLDADTVAELTRDAASALHLALDDAPGASAFQDSSAAAAQLACGSSGCPTSGLEGRQNRAAQFTGGQRLELPNGPINRLTNQFTVAAWVKPDGVSGRQAIAAHGSMNSSSGWSFMLVDSDLALEAFGGDPYRLSNALSGGAQLQAKRWRHVAAVFDAANTVSFYIDGQFKGKLPATFAPAATRNGEPFVIGAQRDSTGSIRSFGGMMDDVWVYGIALNADQIKELYDHAPVMQFAFEDAVGATTYQDSARPGSAGSCSGGCPTVGEGVRGQIGLAAEFDGVNDVVSAPYSDALNVTQYTVGAWVRPLKTAGTTNKYELLAQAGSQTNFALTLDDSMFVSLDPGCGSSGTLKSTTALIPDHWNHVMATYDGQTFRLYINGSESNRLASAHGACAQNNPVRIGGRGATNAQFAGRMDEVVIYNHALPAHDILDIYNYQSGWVEDRQSRTFVVDRDAPSASVAITDGAYLANQPIIVTLKATDDGAGVASADLGVAQGASGGSPAWSAASECADADGGPAWCAAFSPGGSSVYRLYARATDRVGRISQPTMKTVNVDDGAPTLTVDLTEGQRLDAVASGSDANTWLIQLSGTVSDPAIASGVPGSGIPADGARVTLRTADGKALGEPDQPATISGGKWSLAYKVRDAEPSGCYTVDVAAVDNVARLPNLSADQLERHTARISRTVAIDAAAPSVALNEAGMSDGAFGAGTRTLTGEISDRPVRVEIDFQNAAGAELTTAKLTCQHGNNGSWYTLFDQPTGSFTPGVDTRWVGRIHQGSNCKLELTTTGPSGAVGGVIKVCTEGVKSWSGEFSPVTSISFVVQSGSCAAKGCVANPPVAGAQKAEIAFTPLLPGSAWLNEKPPAAEMIHVPFDDSAGQGDPLTIRDVSGVAGNITCSGATCPQLGEPGHTGAAARFDGVDDAVYSNYVAGYDTTDYLTIAAWIKPTGDPQGDGTFIARKGRYIVARVTDGTIRWAFSNQTGFGWHSTGYKAPLNAWTHLVVVYNAGTVTTYANGAAVHSATTQGSITNNSWLEFGGYSTYGHFAGLIDDARVINRALSEAEIKALYTGVGPALVMPFETPLAKGGDAIADSSGWELTAALRTGAGDAANKTMTGEVGNVALKLDGVDDAVSIDNFGVFTTTTISAWIYRTGATDVTGRETIVSYKEAAGCGAVLMLEGQTPRLSIHAGGKWYTSNTGNPQAPANQWTHIVGVYDGARLLVYQDGQLKKNNYLATPAAMDQCDAKTAIGSRNSFDQHWFPGGIDDARVYGRALSAAEIQDLYNAGWRAATFTDGAAGAESASYSASVPAGLQGAYQVDMRGVDAAGHAAAVSDGAMLWQGEVDNVKPAVTLCRALVSGSVYRYVTVAQDFNLTETGFASPCPISSRGYFQSPWLVSGLAAGAQKLNEARAECQSDSTATPQATACDSAGNCATVGLTTGGVCDSLLATAAMVSAAPDSPAPTAPGIIVAPTVLTATHYSQQGIVAITGYITGTTGVTGVEVEIDGAKGQAFLSAPAPNWPYTITWSYPWQIDGAAPDGRTVIATVSAQTNRGPKIPAIEQPLTVDVVAPPAVPLTLNIGGLSVEPGSVLRVPSAELGLSWGAGQDGSGIAGYTVNWTATSAVTTTIISRARGAGDLADRYTASEAQRVAVELTTRDIHGNARSQPWGSVVVDGPLTPDFVLLPPADARGATGTAYDAWMVGDCALLGTDTRATRTGGDGAWPAQALRGSWDSRGVRLSWIGANWSGQGDLFVYLDTAGGGTRATYAPFPVPPTASQLALPPAMAADVAVWVRDSSTANLLKWDGAAWQIAGTLSAGQFRFDEAGGARTDLYLPFELLGMQGGGSLNLVAFATEEPAPEDGLRVWATAPAANPTNSNRSNLRAAWVDALADRSASFPLLRYYSWPATGDGVCPNGSAGGQGNGDVQVSGGVSAEPPGATIEGIGGGIFWVENPAATLSAAANAGDDAGISGADTPGELLLDLLRSGHVPLPEHTPIAYTLRVANTASRPIPGAWLALSAYGPLRLGSDRIEIGDIPAGEERTVTFSGAVDLSASNLKRAIALAQLYSSASGPDKPALEWFVAIHRVDRGGPEDVGLRPLQSQVSVIGGILRGFAQDESGVTQVTAEITGPSGAVTSVLCPAPEAHGGAWRCAWNATAANGGMTPADGATFSLRLQAADRYGQVGQWSAPTAIRVDAQPPTFTVASAVGTVQPMLKLSGIVSDTVGVASISVCVDNTCRNAPLAASAETVSSWSLVLPDAQPMDYVSRTVTISALDTLGNATRQPWQTVVAVDNVAPRVEVAQLAAQLPLAAKLTILQGKSIDGGPFVRTTLLVQTPDGALKMWDVDESGGGWSADLVGEHPGRYLFTVEARDLAGNLTTAGPYAVDVTCVAAELEITAVTAEPTDGMTTTLTLEATLTNRGPDTVPAGVPIGFYDAGGRLAALNTATELAAGATETLTLPPWIVPAEGKYTVYTVPDDPDLGQASPVTLCQRPATSTSVVWAGPQPEPQRIYLPLLMLQPAAQASQ